jgi:ankyrin repeat protein
MLEHINGKKIAWNKEEKLIQSAATGDARLVQMMICSKVVANAADYSGQTPLQLASYHGRAEVIQVGKAQVLHDDASSNISDPECFPIPHVKTTTPAAAVAAAERSRTYPAS